MVYFATGNSDCNLATSPEQCPQTSTYDGVTNIQESVVRFSEDLTTQLGIFTPSNVAYLDQRDADVGSGGVLLLPPQSGRWLAVAGGKDGRLFLLDRHNMATPVDTHLLFSCWCGPSYFLITHKRQPALGVNMA